MIPDDPSGVSQSKDPESQDEFGLLEFDFEDPDVLTALGDVAGPQTAFQKEEGEVSKVCSSDSRPTYRPDAHIGHCNQHPTWIVSCHLLLGGRF